MNSPLRENLAQSRCGLVTNHTGRTLDNITTLGILTQYGANVRALFSPEHGPAGDREGDIESSTAHGLICHSLYGETRRPTSGMLEGLDTLIFDIQDAGARFYTYSTTLCYVLEECAAHGLKLIVLDRPNPLGGDIVEGPLVDEDQRSFIGYAHVPIRHGLTLGELAHWHRSDAGLDIDLHVIPITNWRRAVTWPETALPWNAPSPNLPDYAATEWYPGTCLLEFSGLSVGRGTAAPFATIGAPWLRPEAILEDSASWPPEVLRDITLTTLDFTPERATHEGVPCRGLLLQKTSRARLQPVALGMALLASLRRTHAQLFDAAKLQAALPLLGSLAALEALEAGDIARALQIAALDARRFEAKRAASLIYA